VSRALLLVALVLAGCSSTSVTSTTAEPAPTTTTRAAVTAHLAVIGDDGDVVVMEGDGSDPRVVAAAGAETAFAQPIWSHDGATLSYAKASAEGFAYVIHPTDAEAREVALDQFPFYASWAPDGNRIGILRNGATDVTFELIDVANATSAITDSATPFYFSWEPAGAELVSHAGPTTLVSRDRDGLELEVTMTDAEYLAPQWLDRGVLHVDEGALVLDPVDGDRVVVADVTGPATFIANPQGTRVAALTISNEPAVSVALETTPSLPPNTVSVVDLESGEVTVAHDGAAIAFFWSPDGESLLLLTLNEGGDSLDASVWDEGGTRTYVTYRPHPNQVRELLPFFPQYAQSMSYWSADSTRFALVGAIGQDQGVWVQDIGADRPELVGAGSWAAWEP
jgi:hypothetical protein